VSCLACDLADGRLNLPGGRIHETAHWIVEHTVGPLGLGTLIVKPRRHVLAVAELRDDEAREVGSLLQRAATVVTELIQPEQVYICLWSHADGEPQHIHFVVQPVTRALLDEVGTNGPYLQTALFTRNELPPREQVEAFAERARLLFR
jgi:diadenosine tetraphosphate (Ap4A) HIT family hydrolase